MLHHRLSCLVGAVLVAILTPTLARAGTQENSRRELREAAKEIRDYLRGRDAAAVALEPLVSADKPPSNAGPGLCLLLREELIALEVRIDAAAELKVKGTYEVGEDKAHRPMIYLLLVVVSVKDGSPLKKLAARGAFGLDDVAVAAGATVALPADVDENAREREFNKEQSKEKNEPRSVRVEGARVTAAAGSPYGVEVWVKEGNEYKPRPAKIEDGLAYVPLKRNEVYAVRLVNTSGQEAIATLTIDGLHSFSFCKTLDAKGQPTRLPFLIPPGKGALVRGWPIDAKKSEEFLVTGYAASAVAELKGDPAGVGVITVTFAAAWEKGKPPADEPEGKGDATGRGAPIEAPFSLESRQIGRSRAVVSIRYTR